MNVITRQDILAHQTEVPWPLIHQVEQDLLRVRARPDALKDTVGQDAANGPTLR
jgi:hypothetical protein